MKIGIFGGSFDPVHRGHLALAESCHHQAGLDRVWFVAAAHQPFKPEGPIASNADRLAMLELAIVERGEFEISTIELDRGGWSYTIDTLETIQASMPHAELFLLMGADTVIDFPQWRRPADICRIVTPIVVNRAGEPPPNLEHFAQLGYGDRLAEIEKYEVTMPPMEISSSEIRRLIATGGQWEHLVPPKAATYIRDHRLYQAV